MATLLVVAVGIALLMRPGSLNPADYVHRDLYEGAERGWDAQLQVLPFELVPSTQLTLRWTPPERAYNHFVIHISTPDGTLIRRESGEQERVSLDPGDLEPDTTYVFALQACIDRRCESWMMADQEGTGTTARAPEEPSEESEPSTES